MDENKNDVLTMHKWNLTKFVGFLHFTLFINNISCQISLQEKRNLQAWHISFIVISIIIIIIICLIEVQMEKWQLV